jgi:type III secretory pathway component EscT
MSNSDLIAIGIVIGFSLAGLFYAVIRATLLADEVRELKNKMQNHSK